VTAILGRKLNPWRPIHSKKSANLPAIGAAI
jgi:hypothetical protein